MNAPRNAAGEERRTAPGPARVPLSDRLRAETRSWHDALEATGFAAAMLAGTLPRDRYAGQLAALRVVLGALEEELSGAAATSPAAAGVWSPELAKLPFLERDLTYLSNTAPRVRAPAEAEAFARGIRAAEPLALLGCLYVLEGSTLGARMLRPHVCRAYGLDGPDGAAYYGSGDRDRWSRFTARLNGTVTGPAEQDRVVAGAVTAYGHTRAVTEALSAGLGRR
ncbi:biliverdin-producing heme oxygenase [Streptomyces sp. NPDC008150]|uniref:biliverdin-producing heme oxygenase n=1 Tax=Streptomyces sp. NPDC008150 TaxID=3364816 RepID=UPI0036E2873E